MYPLAQGKSEAPPIIPVTTRAQRQEFHRSATRPDERAAAARRMALGLGWFSLGIGMVQLLAPRAAETALGLPRNGWTARTMGLREVVVGAGLLSSERAAPWLWARVAGDVLDLALLGQSARQRGAHRMRLALASAAVASFAVLDARAAMLQQEADALAQPRHVEHSITVNRPPEEVYRFWRDFANFPRFMPHIVSVTVLSPRRSHWVARAPFGRTLEWDADITIDQPNQLLAWRSVNNPDVANFGAVRFFPVREGRATLLQVELHYAMPSGGLLMWFARLFGAAPEQEVEQDLQRFRQLIESG